MTNPDREELVKIADLRSANVARQQEWDAGNQLTLAYRGNELAGEVGEACNVIKKLERERLGIAGSRDTVAHLAEELADVVICADLIAMHEGIDLLGEAVPAKFNATSEKVGLKTRLASSDGGVKVRELEWGPYPNPVLACDDVAVADITVFGGHKYQVQRDPNAAGYIAFLAPQFGSLFWESKGHATLEAAKAAAQADYEARIRSALVVEPVKGGDEVMREAASAPELKPWRIELDEVIGHLCAAVIQSTASDDQIIMDHVKAAHEIAKIVRRKA